MANGKTPPPPDAHIAACGLFCTNCPPFRKGRCKGCQVQPPFASCPVRRCCVEKGIATCAACDAFAAPRDFRECKKLNSFIAKVFALVFRSNRPAALTLLRDQGLDAYLVEKRATGRQ